MASTTTNGVVLEVPYAIIRNIRNERPWTVSVVGRDPRQYAYNQQQLRSFPATIPQASPGVFVYVGDVITFTLQAPCVDGAAQAFDLYAVNPSTGVESLSGVVHFTAAWQKQITVRIDAINPTTGAITWTPAWS